MSYDRTVGLDYEEPIVAYEDFINKDLIHFSNYDNERSIPSMIDGLKPSQRKIIYACFKRNLLWDKEEIRVS
jgi:DNA topoisomerase-2